MSNMVVRTNINSLNAHRNMKNTGVQQRQASNRLSSGFRINSAADDAAGLAISETMRAQIRGLDQANRNTLDGISLIQTAEGGMQEIGAMIHRMRELVVQAANDTNGLVNRRQIQLEIEQLTVEIDKMAHRVEFNNRVLLSGNYARMPVGSTALALVNAMQMADELNAQFNAIVNTESVVPTSALPVPTAPSARQLLLSNPNLTPQPGAGWYMYDGSTIRIYDNSQPFLFIGATMNNFNIEVLPEAGNVQIVLQGVTISTGPSGNINAPAALNMVGAEVDLWTLGNSWITSHGLHRAGIETSDGTLRMHGPDNILVTSYYNAGIGGGGRWPGLPPGNGGTVEIFGGNVTVQSSNGISMGAGSFDTELPVELSFVTATRLTMHDGILTLSSGSNHNFGGGGALGFETIDGDCGSITINGGTLIAAQNIGIENGRGTEITINGGLLDKLWPTGSVINGRIVYNNGNLPPGINRIWGVGVVDSQNRPLTQVQVALDPAWGYTAGDRIIRTVQVSFNDVTFTIEADAILDRNGNLFVWVPDPDDIGNGNGNGPFPPMFGGGLWFQTGANSNQGLFVNIEAMHATALGILDSDGNQRVNVVRESGEEISELVKILDTSLEIVNFERATLGAIQNRLEYTARSLSISSENLSDAESRIRNADMAREMMDFMQMNVLFQAGMLMLSQANQLPNTVLQLLQN